jgi:hypothetical protein
MRAQEAGLLRYVSIMWWKLRARRITIGWRIRAVSHQINWQIKKVYRILLLQTFYLAGAVGFEPTTNGFGDHYSTVEPYP